MTQLIKTITQLLEEKKREIFVILFIDKCAEPIPFAFDEDLNENAENMKSHIDWFNANKINFYVTMPENLLVGHMGAYYVDFNGFNDQKFLEYSSIFEDASGKSLMPENYQMYHYEYQNNDLQASEN